MSHPPYLSAPPQPGPPAAGPRNGVGTGALLTAVAALAFSWSVLGGIVGGILAVVFGFAGRGRARRGEADNGPIAAAAIGLGALAVVVGIVAVPIWAGFLGDAGVGDYVTCMESAYTDRTAQQQCENEFRDRIEGLSGLGAARP
ncbi:DUF4190 domain-containing protein [Mycobacterium sp. C31M]